MDREKPTKQRPTQRTDRTSDLTHVSNLIPDAMSWIAKLRIVDDAPPATPKEGR